MRTYEGYIERNQKLKCYGIMGLDGTWIKEKLEDGDRIVVKLGNDFFHTDFQDQEYIPSLQPLPWDNWEKLIGKPAAYCDFETEYSKPGHTREEEKRFRFKVAVAGVLLSVAINALLAAGFAGLSAASGDSFADVFGNTFPMCHGLFGGSFVIGAFLMLATNIPEDAALKYGAGFYYGTFLLTGALSEYLHMTDIQLALVLSAVIVGQACYIFWIKHHE